MKLSANKKNKGKVLQRCVPKTRKNSKLHTPYIGRAGVPHPSRQR
jgi:hypothetical protein